MKISFTFFCAAYILSLRSNVQAQAIQCPDNRESIPIDSTDFNEPDWKKILDIAFPPWDMPSDGCPTYDKVGGALLSGSFPEPVAKKFNPCYYTKAFAGLDPMKGGYPTPIDTHYPYEFAAPFFGQPGDGSTHHCKIDAPSSTPIQSCPKVNKACANGNKDCVEMTDEYGIGHIPPFVTLNAVKLGYNDCSQDVCGSWFDIETNGCNIKPSKLDELVKENFAVDNAIQFGPPKLDEFGLPSPFYYKLEYLEQGNACDEGNCRGPHYCSKEVADADIWGDFCPYVHTGENAGQYRHPHLALAAFELWIANSCFPTDCPSEWLDSPNGVDYGTSTLKSTSITWAEMDDNTSPVAQPKVPYEFPNSGTGNFPGLELYEGNFIKPAPGLYVTEYVASKAPEIPDNAGSKQINMWTALTSLISCYVMLVSLL